MKSKILSSIRSRILVYTFAIIILFGTVLGGVVFYALFSSARNNLIRESETSLLYMANSIDSNIDTIRSSTLSSQISGDIANYALGNNASDLKLRAKAHDFLQNTYTSDSNFRNTIIRTIVIGNNRSDHIQFVEPTYSSSKVSKDYLISQPFFEQAVIDEANPTCGIIQDPFLKTRVDIIPFVYTIYHPYKSDAIGYIYTEMSTNALTIPIKNSFPSKNSKYYVKMGNNIYLFNNNSFEDVTDSFKLDSTLNKIDFTLSQKKEFGKSGSLTISYPLGINDWYIISTTDTSVIWNGLINLSIIVLFIVIAFSVLVGIILYGQLSKMVSIPVQKLTDRIIRIEGGDFSRDTETEWNNELGDIGRTINDLSENVYSLMNQRIEDEKQKKDYEYQILQSQINPHFLYNTLNSIKWMATIQNAPGIAEMTTALSRLLKDISKGTNTIISLKHELDLMDDYFTIQSYRYGGTISLKKTIESDDLLDCNILRFTLQPLVENAVKHGLMPLASGGKIKISSFEDDKAYYVRVEDNGVGFDVNNPKPKTDDHRKHIGLSNIKERLAVMVNGKLEMESKVGKGTVATIVIPKVEA